MTDINDLDQHVGRYVDITSPDGTGASGFLVEVSDQIEYQPHPARIAILDYGYGWPVGQDTRIDFPDPPESHSDPEAVGPVRAMHLAMHYGDECEDVEECTYERLAVHAIRGFREWQMKQVDAYWENQYVSKVRSYAKSGDGHEVGDVIRDARHEGAPPHMVDRMERIAREHLGDPEPVEDWDPFGDSDGPSGS